MYINNSVLTGLVYAWRKERQQCSETETLKWMGILWAGKSIGIWCQRRKEIYVISALTQNTTNDKELFPVCRNSDIKKNNEKN